MLGRNVSLYWRLLASYLLIILVGCVTLYWAGDAFAVLFYDQHMGGMMNRMRGMDGMMDAMTADLGEAYRRTTQQAMVWGMGVAALVASGVSLFVTGRIVSPLKQMQGASQRIASGQYGGRLDTQMPGEIGDLARTFNEMASALETTERRRIELLDNVAHEFKTPLSNLRGYLDGLVEGVFDCNEETVTICERQLTRLERLVADISLLSRVETGQEFLQTVPVEAVTLLDGVVAAFQPQSREKGVALSLEFPPARVRVLADAQRTGQVLSNLVANALRHTPEGGKIWLSAKQRDPTEVVFGVADTGEGISPEDLPHIFTRFYRADKARTRDGGEGSGVGLTIAKHYVKMQGGRIWAESSLTEGSCFWFTLPSAIDHERPVEDRRADNVLVEGKGPA